MILLHIMLWYLVVLICLVEAASDHASDVPSTIKRATRNAIDFILIASCNHHYPPTQSGWIGRLEDWWAGGIQHRGISRIGSHSHNHR